MELIIKGFIIGLGKIIPGVSGAMLAISLGMYEEIIENISTLTTKFKQSTKYLIKPAIGIMFAIIFASKIIVKCLKAYYLPTMLLFIGIIVSGMPELIKSAKIKNCNKKTIIILIIIIIIIILTMNKIKIKTIHHIDYSIIEFIKLVIIGAIDASTSIIPGISGTVLLMILGYYDIILNTFSTINEIPKIPQNLFVMIPFTLGFILGTMLLSRIINKIIKTKKELIQTIVIIFMTTTLIKLTTTIIITNQSTITYLIGIIFFLLGLYIGNRINNIERRINK